MGKSLMAISLLAITYRMYVHLLERTLLYIEVLLYGVHCLWV